MSFADSFLPEFDHEMKTTRSLLERVPFDRATFKPHPKSTALGPLASHVANLVGYGDRIVNADELDFAPGGQRRLPREYGTTADLLAAFDENVTRTRAAIQTLKTEQLGSPWTLRMGERTIFTQPRASAIRSFMMNHLIHHRGQLSVYLRLNEVPLPSLYGPTADT
jgi:uncharacterized damage-inducible protein DinB